MGDVETTTDGRRELAVVIVMAMAGVFVALLVVLIPWHPGDASGAGTVVQIIAPPLGGVAAGGPVEVLPS